MDHETGETLTEILYPMLDNGEIINYTVEDETGEEISQTLFHIQQRRFKIPIHYYKKFDKSDKAETTKNSEIYYTNDYTACIMFLLPSILAFVYPFLITFFVFLELLLHVKTHRFNSVLKPDKLVFHSPLHVLTSQFCQCCRVENCGEKFAKFSKQLTISHSKKWYSVLS